MRYSIVTTIPCTSTYGIRYGAGNHVNSIVPGIIIQRGQMQWCTAPIINNIDFGSILIQKFHDRFVSLKKYTLVQAHSNLHVHVIITLIEA